MSMVTMHCKCSYNASIKIEYIAVRGSMSTLVVLAWRRMMTKSQYVIKMPIKAALKYRVMFHVIRIAQTVGLPVLLYVLVFYRNTQEVRKFDLPEACLYSVYDQIHWWNVPPIAILLMGIVLYWMIVWIFHDRKNESGIVNLVNKNINSDQLIEVKI